MIPELGHFALVLALLFSVVLGTFPLLGAQVGRPAWMALARPAAWGLLLFVALSYAALTHAFWAHDFSVAYVAAHSNSALPTVYRITAVWGGHEGSILLWILVMAGWTAAVAARSRHLDDAQMARTLAVMGLVSCGFLLFTLLTSNPFERLLPAAADGRDLNPLLQDPGMILHPPLLYMGYVGFLVPFAMAVAALISGRLDAAWARWSRPWTGTAWAFLTLGIALGSYWAYYELGWGGWWFWDPVENASLLPWLAGTALLHSLAVAEKRGSFKAWTVLLAILSFSLSLLGTFLVRSGVLSSVHAFATDPTRGIFILGFLGVVIGGSLALFAWRAPRIGAGAAFHTVSRESLLLANNVLLLVAAAAVLLGTLYPLALDALGLGMISVGPPYFEAVFVPLMAPALFLMGIGPLARWRQAGTLDLARRLRWAAGVSVAAALIAPWVLGHWTPLLGLGLGLACWIVLTCGVSLRERLRGAEPGASAPGLAGTLRRLTQQPLGYHGMLLAHAGVAVLIVGVTLVKGFEIERDLRLSPGESATVAGYTYTLTGIHQRLGPNFVATVGTLDVTRDGRDVTTLRPERRLYIASGLPMSETAIHSGLTRDLYAALGEPIGESAWAIRLHHKPFVNWIWVGCLIMALGAALAVGDRRYRLLRQPRTDTRDALAPGHGSAAVQPQAALARLGTAVTPAWPGPSQRQP